VCTDGITAIVHGGLVMHNLASTQHHLPLGSRIGLRIDIGGRDARGGARYSRVVSAVRDTADLRIRPPIAPAREPAEEKMKATLLHPLEKLEARTEPETRPLIRYGWVKPLPKGFSGERHLMIVKREPTGSPHAEWCAFEEREGPARTDGSTVALTARS
jgi:hypothetical protein